MASSKTALANAPATSPPVCTCDLPPFVDPDDLSAVELQNIVVRAVRSYQKFKTGELGASPFLMDTASFKDEEMVVFG